MLSSGARIIYTNPHSGALGEVQMPDPWEEPKLLVIGQDMVLPLWCRGSKLNTEVTESGACYYLLQSAGL